MKLAFKHAIATIRGAETRTRVEAKYAVAFSLETRDT
jgi:hypothetical protein